ncbi:MAG TPA: nucleotide disphospho-sugar-binding domain-containing protein [Caulobacteraceae bacterium]|nr:nucleotide disphospho-sugar-binding domain-containing protein [Caulobacteraceae bacterium]
MRRKVVISTAGSSGDLNPFIALGLALKERGFEPLIASQVEFREKVEAEGLQFHALRPSLSEVKGELGLDVQTIFRRATNGSSGLAFLVRRIAMPFLRRAYEDMMSATEDAVMVVTHPSAYAARLAADTRGLMWVSAVLAPFTVMSAYDPPVLSTAPGLATLRELTGARFDAALLAMIKRMTDPWTAPFRNLRSELGLPPVANPLFEGQFSPYGTLAMYSHWLGEIQPDYPTNCQITGFAFYDSQAGGKAELSPDLQRFLAEGPAPLVFTLGTAVVIEPGDFWRRSLQIARKLGRRAVLVGASSEGPELGLRPGEQLPSWAHAVQYVPHSLIFPHAEAIVHHGGVGTTAQALRSGRPQLVVPYMGDQPDNAARMVRLGVARTLPPNAYSARRAAGELDALMSYPAYKAKAAEIAASVAKEDGAAACVDIIETLLAQETQRLRVRG